MTLSPRVKTGLIVVVAFLGGFGLNLWRELDSLQQQPMPNGELPPWMIPPPNLPPEGIGPKPTPGAAPVAAPSAQPAPTDEDDWGAGGAEQAAFLEEKQRAQANPEASAAASTLDPGGDAEHVAAPRVTGLLPAADKDEIEATLEQAKGSLEDCLSQAWVGPPPGGPVEVDLELRPASTGDRSELAPVGLPEGIDVVAAKGCMTTTLRAMPFAFQPTPETVTVSLQVPASAPP